MELIEMKNDLGETPLFRAAAFGRTKLERTFLSKVKNMESHRRRKDTSTILYIAFLGKYFGKYFRKLIFFFSVSYKDKF